MGLCRTAVMETIVLLGTTIPSESLDIAVLSQFAPTFQPGRCDSKAVKVVN
jgi:hypothetical protein